MKPRNLIALLAVVAVAGCAAGLTPSPNVSPESTPNETIEGLSSPTFPPPPTTVPRTSGIPLPSPGATPGPLFDGSIYGWRIAPTDVLEREGLDRNLTADCEPRRYGRRHETDLDLPAGYLPSGARSIGVEKWACGRTGFSVSESFAFDAYPGRQVDVYRAIWGSKSADLWASADAVRACEVQGLRAVCVDESLQGVVDRGLDHIIVIEDGQLDPHVVVLRLQGDELPFAELMRIAEDLAGS